MRREIFIERAKEKFGEMFTYILPEDIKDKDKINIICPEHGEVFVRFDHFLNSKYGCPICAKNKRVEKSRRTAEEFISLANEAHNFKYDYTNAKYVNDSTKLCIKCPEHGEFWQSPNKHLAGQGCPECGKKRSLLCAKENIVKVHEKIRIPKENVISELCEKYKNSIVFKEDTFTKKSEDILCKCLNCGYEFYRKPAQLLFKGNFQLCPNCSQKHSIYEEEVFHFFDSLIQGTEYSIERQKTFPFLKNNDNNSLFVDFLIPEKKIIIEVQGEQHFMPVDFNDEGDEKAKVNFERQCINDEIKYQRCTENGYTVLYFSKVRNIPDKFKEKHKYIQDFDSLKNEIEALL